MTLLISAQWTALQCQLLTGSQPVEPEPECIITIKYMFIVVLTLENGRQGAIIVKVLRNVHAGIYFEVCEMNELLKN